MIQSIRTKIKTLIEIVKGQETKRPCTYNASKYVLIKINNFLFEHQNKCEPYN